jgi:hypothetical protein
MTSGIRTIVYPVKDLAQAKTLYGKAAVRGSRSPIGTSRDDATTSASAIPPSTPRPIPAAGSSPARSQ